jgi:hypothetical protein
LFLPACLYIGAVAAEAFRVTVTFECENEKGRKEKRRRVMKEKPTNIKPPEEFASSSQSPSCFCGF